MEKRNRYTAEFKAKVVIELLKEESTLNQLALKYEISPQMLSQWKGDFIKNAAMIFERSKDESTKLKKTLEEKETRYQQIIGQMSYEIDWLKKNLALNNSSEVRKKMAEFDNKKINLTRQANLLSVNGTSLYRQPSKTNWSQIDLEDMRLIDEIYTKCPFYGYRRITAPCIQEGAKLIGNECKG